MLEIVNELPVTNGGTRARDSHPIYSTLFLPRDTVVAAAARRRRLQTLDIVIRGIQYVITTSKCYHIL